MATETENWYPVLPDPPAAPSVCSARVCSGAAAPSNDDGQDGNIYIRDNGSIYRKENGAWTLLFTSAGGSSIQQVYEYTTTDPTTDGVVPDEQNEIAFAGKRDGTGPIFVWNKVAHTWG